MGNSCCFGNAESESKDRTKSTARTEAPDKRSSLNSLVLSSPPVVSSEFHSKYIQGVQIGNGGFSTVYECFNKETNEKYAVKIFEKDEFKPGHEIKLFREVSILSALNHPHIVKFVDSFNEPDNFYVVTEILNGGDLYDRIVKKISYTEQESREVMSILFQALKYCHDNGIVHRDLKPENLLLPSYDSDSNIKIADFGFAIRCHGFNLTTKCGSPTYVAPEIIRKDLYGLPSDMWSAGVIMFILLSGYPPFADENVPRMYSKILRGRYEFYPAVWRNVSEEAKDLVRRLLTVDMYQRITVDQALAHPWFCDQI